MKQDVGALPQAYLSRRKFAMGLLFCSVAGIAAWRQPTQPLDYLGHDKLENIIPDVIGPWHFATSSGLVIPPSDQLSDALYSQLLTRVYQDGINPPVMLLMAQSVGQTGVLQVHRPETCYPASGYKLSPTAQQEVRFGTRSIMTNKLVATADAISEQILYWTRVGDRMPMSWREQRIAVAEQNLRGIIPDAILIRVSMRSYDDRSAFGALDSFVKALVESLPEDKQRILVV